MNEQVPTCPNCDEIILQPDNEWCTYCGTCISCCGDHGEGDDGDDGDYDQDDR